MNEGKPTKAKWWSRPRPQEPAGETGDEVILGSGEDERAAVDAPGGAAHGDRADGDFELAKPAGNRGGDAAAGAGAGAAADDGDYELSLPSPGTSSGAEGVAGSEGDFEWEAPLAASGVDSAPQQAPAEERPKPLHDPDPYSTPPYGKPGPWAPAPPVQHPAATPAPCTATAAPVPETPAPPAPDGRAFAAPLPAVGPDPAMSVPAPAPTAPATGQVPAPTAPATGQVPAASAFAADRAPAPTDPAAGPVPAAPTPYGVTPSPGSPVPTASVPGTPAAHGPTLADPDAAHAGPWHRYDPWAAAPFPGGPLQQNGAAVPSRQQRRGRARKALVGAAVLLAVVSGGVGGVVGAQLERNGGIGEVELPQAAAEPTGRAPDSVAGIAASALPSVVTLHVDGSAESGTGTGFVLDSRGHILTNNHVVEPAGADGGITVVFNGGETAKAEVVGRDSGYDLAVVKVSGVSGLKPLPLGNSDNVQVGDPVVAIGAPFDLEGTVTSGIISAKERPITAGGESDGSDVSYVDALQTDAPINPGNSGGPLLDSKARVIGINSAIRSADDGSDSGGQAGSIGLGFAIPINQGKRVAEELINTGRATHPVIGITLDMDYTGDGARVGTKGGDGGPSVTVGGPGDQAGIKAGDVITEVDGQRIHSGDELIVKTRAHRPGDHLELTIERNGTERTVSLVLGASDGD
ncbi:trypsin-like peptidase domain-containing protein [Streptomyces sp. HUAS ZL42]|uniref:trypsin-like peptidase domain-containing protein n=1 Tax=Streptomyces sp. HUAS ZL42 TaxID=3231715 RepID=UPI00345E8C83